MKKQIAEKLKEVTIKAVAGAVYKSQVWGVYDYKNPGILMILRKKYGNN